MLKRTAVYTVISLSLFSCVARRFNTSETQRALDPSRDFAWKHGSAIQSPDRITYVFHWTNGSTDKREVERTLRSTADNAHSANKNISGSVSDTLVGHGIYSANDPFSSSSYGKVLVALPILPHTNAVVDNIGYRDNAASSKLILDNTIDALAYDYNGYMVKEKKGLRYAFVIRNSKLVDWSRIEVYDATRSADQPWWSDKNPELVFAENMRWRDLMAKNMNSRSEIVFGLSLLKELKSNQQLEEMLSLIALKKAEKRGELALVLPNVNPHESVDSLALCKRSKQTGAVIDHPTLGSCFKNWIGALAETAWMPNPEEMKDCLEYARKLALLPPANAAQDVTQLRLLIGQGLTKQNPLLLSKNQLLLPKFVKQLHDSLYWESMASWMSK